MVANRIVLQDPNRETLKSILEWYCTSYKYQLCTELRIKFSCIKWKRSIQTLFSISSDPHNAFCQGRLLIGSVFKQVSNLFPLPRKITYGDLLCMPNGFWPSVGKYIYCLLVPTFTPTTYLRWPERKAYSRLLILRICWKVTPSFHWSRVISPHNLSMRQKDPQWRVHPPHLDHRQQNAIRRSLFLLLRRYHNHWNLNHDGR